MKEVGGIFVALLTPFTKSGNLYIEGIRNIIEWVKEGGVHGIFPNSSSGEALRMNREERIFVTSKVIEYTPSSIMVIPGISGNTTDSAIDEAKRMEDIGAKAIVIIPPYYYKLSKRALKDFYLKIIENINIPCILYNIPSASCNKIDIDIASDLVETGKILGIKDSSGNFSYTRLLIKKLGDKISVMQGSELFLFQTLIFGGKGGILGLANLAPKLFVKLYNSFIKGNLTEASRLQKVAYDILEKVYEGTADSFFLNLKYTLKELGVDVGYPRKPYTEKVNEKNINDVINILKTENLI